LVFANHQLYFITGAFYGLGYLKVYSNPAAKLNLHWIMFAIFHLSMVLVCIVQNGFVFLVIWEIMSLSSAMLVMFDGHNPKTLKAGINYLVQMHISIVLLTVGFIWLYAATGSFNFDSLELFFIGNNNIWLFLVFFAGFGLKLDLFHSTAGYHMHTQRHHHTCRA
jgi:formate hydrogenlyase subunit 3/multisubunit Na+/H+ antiporter MnhD subunit